MTAPSFYREPVLLDSVLHRNKKVGKLTDFSVAQHLHSSYLATAEFDQAVATQPPSTRSYVK